MDLKTSLLVNNQLPEFVREEYPLFVSFLEAYYEFLETERYVNGVSQKNNLTEKLKDLRNLSDIDFSLNDFEEQFFNTFLSYLPKDTLISKDFLIKNILPLYQSKGTQKSFQYLFRLLFGQEIQIEYPGDNILRASDGKWVVESVLRTETQVYSEYISDGMRKVYYLPYIIESSLIQITINGELTTNYYVRKEDRKIVFNYAPLINTKVKIEYLENFDTTIFNSKEIVGLISGAKSIVEKTGRRNIAGLNFYQFFINNKNTVGTFKNGEITKIEVIVDSQTIPFYFQTISDVQNLTIVTPGSNYQVGDGVIFRGSATEPAVAVVDKVSSGKIDNLTLRIGNFGAGYKVNNEVYAATYSSNSFSALVDVVDDTGTISPNTFTYFNVDIITPYLSLNISDPDYGFPSNVVPSENVNTVISQALTSNTVTDLGPVGNIVIQYTNISSNANVEFIANSTLLFDTTRISDYNSIGTVKVIQQGSGYSVGNRVDFVNTEYFSGQGALARVSAVGSSGQILKVTVENGGYNYRSDYLPTLVVDSVGGSNAILQVEHFMGQNVKFDYIVDDGIPGKILDVKLLNTGKGYITTPIADMKFSGDGNAVINVNTRTSFVQFPGRWVTSDGMISSDEMRLQGRNYYIDFSYVISSQIEFQRYKNIVKELLNPSGSVNYARYTIFDNIETPMIVDADDISSRQLSGTVNVSTNSVFVLGTNTFFELAFENDFFDEGTVILVNNEIRIVNSIINNTTITVSEAFDYNANDQLITILTLPYNSITTESWRELSLNINGIRSVVITTEE